MLYVIPCRFYPDETISVDGIAVCSDPRYAGYVYLPGWQALSRRNHLELRARPPSALGQTGGIAMLKIMLAIAVLWFCVGWMACLCYQLAFGG